MKSKTYKSTFQESLDFTDWLKYFSSSVWEQLRKNYINRSIKSGETRITGRLIEEIYDMFIDDIPLPLRLFHSKKESTNGNDLEVIIPISNNRYILFPCQAKRIYYPANNYQAISHPSKKMGTEQIVSLIKYAKDVGGIPLYLFYNFVNRRFDTKDLEKELYGCTLMSADKLYEDFYDTELKKLQTPKFIDILNDVNTFSILGKFLNGKASSQLIEQTFGKSNIRIKSYSESDLLRLGLWDEWLPSIEEDSSGRKVSVPEISTTLSEKSNVIQYPFSPKYRIMITPYTITKRQNF
jgi:hypothetical protein